MNEFFKEYFSEFLGHFKEPELLYLEYFTDNEGRLYFIFSNRISISMTPHGDYSANDLLQPEAYKKTLKPIKECQAQATVILWGFKFKFCPYSPCPYHYASTVIPLLWNSPKTK
jgi:hypothetical protein